MAKQDDINRLDAVAAVIALHDRIKELEVEVDQLQRRCEDYVDEIVDLRAKEE